MYTDSERLELLKKLTWDTNQSAEDLLRILKSPTDDWDTKSLYIKILNFFYWHQVHHLVPTENLHSMLTDEVIRGLFPRPLREKYKYVRSLL